MTADARDLLCLDLPHPEAVRSRMPDDDAAATAAAHARALGEPTRIRLASALAVGGELCVWDLAWVCSLAQNLVSHHVRLLRSAGLAASRRDGKLVMYRLTPVGRSLLTAVLGTDEVARPQRAAATHRERHLLRHRGLPTHLGNRCGHCRPSGRLRPAVDPRPAPRPTRGRPPHDHRGRRHRAALCGRSPAAIR